MKYYLAIDIGASSGRHILGHLENGKMILEEVHRFPNGAKKVDGTYVWDTEALLESIIEGIEKCGTLGKIPESVAIDTWGVDYMLIDKDGKDIGRMTAYRDSRTNGMLEKVSEIISDSELYNRTGSQIQLFNTIYQLYAHKLSAPEDIEKAERFIMVPDYFAYRLTGNMFTEYTEASTTGLLNAAARTWDDEIISRLGLKRSIFGEISFPGTFVGNLLPELKERVGFDTKVLLAATHDTASAVMAVPSRDENAVYISSGTWSLMGVENSVPITTEESRLANLTNEGGYNNKYRYLKNIMGLWIIQSIRHNFNDKYSFSEIDKAAAEASDFPSIINVNDNRFLMPENMTEAIKEYCRETNQPIPETLGEIAQCAYASLAECYNLTVKELEGITGRKFTSINIVGGGSQSSYLNKLTAKATGLPVFAGPTEGTAIGNIILQMITAEEFTDLQSARNCVKLSFNIQEIN